MKKVDPMIEMELEENSQGDTIVRSCSFEYTYQDEDGAYKNVRKAHDFSRGMDSTLI